ncbi:MAG: hypothetical protein H6500_04860 [Candidatus Woesearchaeota archaeon]|nr:MAG: hypothetical protein H6500_04860 [Candidatus Woesearchaeota archaeon]
MIEERVMKREVEKLKITGLQLEKVFDKNFLRILNGKEETFPISLVFVREIGEGREKTIKQLQLSRESSIDKKDNTLHITSNDEGFMEEFIALLAEKND